MKRVLAFCFAIFLTLSLMVPVLSVGVHAAEADGFSAVPNDAWEGGSAQFTGKDGSVTTVYDSGSVVTQYPDGRTFGVDYLGNKHIKDKDGTYTVTGKNGDVAREYPDGTQELTEVSGKKLVQNPDGSGKTVYPSGLVIEHNSEHTPTAVFFEGGKERLEADESGRFPNGEIAGPDGKKLINTEDGLEMTGKNGTWYSVTNSEDGPGSASVVHADGSYVKYENGQAEMRLSDGSSFTYTDDGKGKWSMADGSYLYRDDLSKAWGQYDAASGFQVECNENGELVNLYTTSDNGGVLRIKDGEIVEWEDPDSGISVKQAEDGSVTASVTTEEGTYSADGSGNVWLNGKQIKKGGELIVDGGSSGSSEHSPSKPRPSGGTSGGELDSYTITVSTRYAGRVADDWDDLIYLSFCEAGEIQVTRQQDGTYAFTLPGYEYNTGSATSSDRVSVPELRFVGTGFNERPDNPGYYQAKFTLQQDDIMKLTRFRHREYEDGRVIDDYRCLYLKEYWFTIALYRKYLSEDGTVELSSDASQVSTFHLIDPDRPVSEKDFSERGSSYLHCGFTATGLESLRSGHSGNKQSGNVFQWAGTDSGEDGGVAIPVAIAIGLLGTGAAVAAGAGGASGAAAGTDGGESGEDERKKKRYKMYIQKDFGDAIRKGADPVTVRARIAEVSEDGTERDRNDLTAQINSVSGDGMEIHRAAFAGRYCEADVSIPEDYEGETADITFTFEGEGGSFNNTVRFRAVGEPKIMFLDKDDAAGRGICEIDAIFGDGFTYVRRFRLEDAVTFPAADAFSAKGPEDIALSFETTETPGIYSVSIANKTSEPDGNDPHWNIFNKKERRAITISVTAEGEREPTTCDVYVSLYPVGISVESRNLQVDDKQPDVRYVVARSYEKDEGSYGGLDSKWQSSEIKFNLAVMENDGAVVNPENADFEAQKIKGANSLTEAIVEKYKYKEKTNKIGDQNVYYFEPNSTLYEDAPGFEGSRMMILLPVSFRYNGKTVDADVQIRLKGIEMDPMEKWEREYEKLRERIQTFSFEEDKEYWLQQLESLAIEPRADVKELRLASKYLVGKYMRYWTRQGEAHMRDVAFYDFMISTLEWTKFFGDCAFSLLISVYAGPLADAVISPAKDFFVGALGEIIAADKFTLDTFDKFEFSKNLAAAGDNILANSISFANYKTALATLGGYFVYSAFKNYIVKWNEEGVSDMWGALVGAFSDMTINVIKIGASALLGKWMSSSDTFQKKIAPTFDKYFKQTYFSNFQAQYNRWQQLYGELALKGASDTATIALSDVLDKYVSELVGEGAGWVSEQIDDLVDAGGFSLRDGSVCYSVVLNFSEDSKCKITIDILKALNYVTCPLTSFLIDLIFGSNMPAAAAPIEIPQDPPLPEDK